MSLWFAYGASRFFDVYGIREDKELVAFWVDQFNLVWLHVTREAASGQRPDWVYVARVARKMWTAFIIWQSKTGRRSPFATYEAFVRAALGALSPDQRARVLALARDLFRFV